MLRPVLALLVAATAPAPPVAIAEQSGAGNGSPTAVAGDTYEATAAAADLEIILHDRGQAYLAARGRIEAHPTIAGPLIARRLAGPPAGLNPAERQRLLILLGALGRPEDLAAFAEELRRAAKAAPSGQVAAAIEPWRLLLREQGAAAAEPLATLVADRELEEEVRALLLGDLIDLLPPDQLPSYVGLVGKGSGTLPATLKRALASRARRRPAERPAILEAIDGALGAAIDGALGAPANPRQQAALLALRASLSEPEDLAFVGRLLAFAEDLGAPFVVRVAAIRLLGALGARAGEGAAILGTLRRIARDNLEPTQRQAQAAELLGWLALQALPPAAAAEVIRTLDLQHADEPRLATAAFDHGPLPADPAWLDEALENPWPEVRKAALARLGPPCDRSRSRLLGELAGPPTRAGDRDDAVAREALRALGRCGADGSAALIKVLQDKQGVPRRRAEAAKQLLRGGDPQGERAVIRALETIGEPSVVRRLIEACRAATDPSPALLAALCQAAADLPTLASTVAATLRSIAPENECSP